MAEPAPAPAAPVLAPARRIAGPLRQVLRALVFLVLLGFLAYILLEPIQRAFLTNPGLNGLIVGALIVGVLIAMVEFRRLSLAAQAGTAARRGEAPEIVAANAIMSPVAGVLRRESSREGALEALSIRLDEGRETLRYLAGILVFLGLLGTFWGLLETVSSVGGVIKSLRSGADAGVLFDDLKTGLAAPLAGMGLSFSSSLFGIAGSLVLGFLDLQLGQAQRRLRTDVEDWFATLAQPMTAAGLAAPAFPVEELTERLDRLAAYASENSKGSRAANAALANLADGIQNLVHHMRSEQQMIRDWVEAQASRERELKRLLDRLAERERLL